MSTTSEKQWRATFEDTKKAQENLRIELDKLDAHNNYVEPDDRKHFFELLADALLGFDYGKHCNLPLPNMTYVAIENIGEFIRRLAYHTGTKVDYEFFKYYKKIEIQQTDIGQIWHELKFFIYGIYPEAIAMSIRISKEQIEMLGREAEATSYDEALQD